MASSSKKASNDTNNLDLAFILDTTSSMGTYIQHAKDNINKIADEIIKSEKCHLRLALVQYRDHPPQEKTFVTKVNNFTDNIKTAKKFISGAKPVGGGDFPESICCGLFDSLNKLTWRNDSVKIAILIADAPPHGLHNAAGDQMPRGCPDRNDPVQVVGEMAEKSITLYCIGCEPGLTPYRVFFAALALITGGKYVPLDQADNLSEVIVGGSREEMSLERLMAKVHEEVLKEAADKGQAVNEDELTKRIHQVLNSHGAKANKMKINNVDNIEITEDMKELSKCKTLAEMNQYLKTRNIIGNDLITPLTIGGFIGGGGLAKAPRGRHPTRGRGGRGGKGGRGRGVRRGKRKVDEEDDEEEKDNAKETFRKKAKLDDGVDDVAKDTEDGIDMEVARRLVKKSLARNKLRK